MLGDSALYYYYPVHVCGNSLDDLKELIEFAVQLAGRDNLSLNFEIGDLVKKEAEETQEYYFYAKFKMDDDGSILALRFIFQLKSKHRCALKNRLSAKIKYQIRESWDAFITLINQAKEEWLETNQNPDQDQDSNKEQDQDQDQDQDSDQDADEISFCAKYSEFNLETIDSCLKGILHSLRRYRGKQQELCSPFQKQTSLFYYDFEVESADRWLVDDVAKGSISPSIHPRTSTDAYHKLVLGRPDDNRILSQFKKAVNKALEKTAALRISNNQNLIEGKVAQDDSDGDQDQKMQTDVVTNHDLILTICKDIALNKLYSNDVSERQINLWYGQPGSKLHKHLLSTLDPLIKEYLQKFQAQKNSNEFWLSRKTQYYSQCMKGFAFESEWTEETLEAIGDIYFLNLPFKMHLTCATTEKDIITDRYNDISLSIGRPEKEQQVQSMSEYLKSKLAKFRASCAKLGNEHVLNGRLQRNQRFYQRRQQSSFALELEDIVLEHFQETVDDLVKEHVLSMEEKPLSIGDVKCYLGITKPDLLTEVYKEFNSKLALQKTLCPQEPLPEKQKQEVVSFSELISLFHIQVGPQILNRGFRLYFIDIIYTAGMEEEVSKLARQLSSLKIHYTSKDQIFIKVRKHLFHERLSVHLTRQADLYLFYFDFKKSEQIKLLTSLVSKPLLWDNKDTFACVVQPPQTHQNSNLDIIGQICSAYLIELIPEEDKLKMLAKFVLKVIRRKVRENNIWQEIYREAFLDFEQYKNPETDCLDYRELINFFNASLPYGEFNSNFNKEFLKPRVVKQIKTREQIIEIHFSITHDIKSKIEVLKKKIAKCEQDLNFPINPEDDIKEEPQEETDIKENLETLTVELQELEMADLQLRLITLTPFELEEMNKNSENQKRYLNAIKVLTNEKHPTKMLSISNEDDYDQRVNQLKVRKEKLNAQKTQILQLKENYCSPAHKDEAVNSKINRWFLVNRKNFEVHNLLGFLESLIEKRDPSPEDLLSHFLKETIKDKVILKYFDPTLICKTLKLDAAGPPLVLPADLAASLQDHAVLANKEDKLEKLDTLIKNLKKHSLGLILANHHESLILSEEMKAYSYHSQQERTKNVQMEQEILSKLRKQSNFLVLVNDLNCKLELLFEEKHKLEVELGKINAEQIEIQYDMNKRNLEQAIHILLQRQGEILLEINNERNKLEKEMQWLRSRLNQEQSVAIYRTKQQRVQDFTKYLQNPKFTDQDVQSLREYYFQFQKSITSYYRISEIIESNVFERSKESKGEGNGLIEGGVKILAEYIDGDILDSAISNGAKAVAAFAEEAFEKVISFVPFGSAVFGLLKLGKKIYNHQKTYKEELKTNNDYQTFSSLISSPSVLDDILELAALALLKEKEPIILNVVKSVQKTWREKADDKVNSLFIKKELLHKGLNTGAKAMAALDATSVIMNSYANFISKSHLQTPKPDLEDIYEINKTVQIFVQTAKDMNTEGYSQLLELGTSLPPISGTIPAEEQEKRKTVATAKPKQSWWANLFACSSSGGKKGKVAKNKLVRDITPI